MNAKAPERPPVDDPHVIERTPTLRVVTVAAGIVLLLVVAAMPVLGMIACDLARPHVSSIEPIAFSALILGMLILVAGTGLLIFGFGGFDDTIPSHPRLPLRPPVPPPPPRPINVRKES